MIQFALANGLAIVICLYLASLVAVGFAACKLADSGVIPLLLSSHGNGLLGENSGTKVVAFTMLGGIAAVFFLLTAAKWAPLATGWVMSMIVVSAWCFCVRSVARINPFI